MKEKVPDWLLQTLWFVAGIFATGSMWYFLSVRDVALAVASIVLALIIAAIAILLHRNRDRLEATVKSEKEREERLYGELTLNVGDERVTFSELHRSTEYDIVKVNANNHFLGVASEHAWIHARYPDAEKEMQSLTTLDRLKLLETNESESAKIHFDVIDILFPDGRKKKIYFDISNFFNGSTYAKVDPESRVAKKLNDLYS